MAAITAVITAGVALAGLGMSVKQASDAEKARKQAESAADVAAKSIENLNTQNAYQNLAIPTMGTDLAQQALDRQSQANINALKGAGAEGVLGGAGCFALAATGSLGATFSRGAASNLFVTIIKSWRAEVCFSSILNS